MKVFIELMFNRFLSSDIINVRLNLDFGFVLNRFKRKCSEKEFVFRLLEFYNYVRRISDFLCVSYFFF